MRSFLEAALARARPDQGEAKPKHRPSAPAKDPRAAGGSGRMAGHKNEVRDSRTPMKRHDTRHPISGQFIRVRNGKVQP